MFEPPFPVIRQETDTKIPIVELAPISEVPTIRTGSIERMASAPESQRRSFEPSSLYTEQDKFSAHSSASRQVAGNFTQGSSPALISETGGGDSNPNTRPLVSEVERLNLTSSAHDGTATETIGSPRHSLERDGGVD
jgi:hypothetical protein